MTLTDLPEAVREYLRAFESGDVSMLARWIAADVDYLQIGDDGDPKTEKAMIQGLGLACVKAVIEGLHEMLRDFCIETYEAGAYGGEPDVWSVKFHAHRRVPGLVPRGEGQKVTPRTWQRGREGHQSLMP